MVHEISKFPTNICEMEKIPMQNDLSHTWKWMWIMNMKYAYDIWVVNASDG